MTMFDNEKLFDHAGHLTADGLCALRDGTLDELGSLEAAEHLTYCDACLERYTSLLSAAPEALMTPRHDVLQPVQSLLRMRSVRVFTNRYVSVAAAVVMAFGLWQAGAFSLPAAQKERPIPEKPKYSISDSVSDVLHSVNSSIDGLFNDIQARAESGFAQLSDLKAAAKNPGAAKAPNTPTTTKGE